MPSDEASGPLGAVGNATDIQHPSGDNLYGGTGDGVLEGGEGRDVLVTGDSIDMVNFADMSNRDTCEDFDAKRKEYDFVDLSGLSGVDGFEDLTDDHMKEKGGNVILTGDGGDRLPFLDMNESQFKIAVFIFDTE